jgi:hypothetical protein
LTVFKLIGPASIRAPSAEPTDTLVQADGTRRRLGSIRSGDRDRVAPLFARLRHDSRYRRFLSPKRESTPRELSVLTDIDHIQYEPVAAVDQRNGSIAGIGRYVGLADQPQLAELGVGWPTSCTVWASAAFARRTVQRARTNGFALLTATTLCENQPGARCCDVAGSTLARATKSSWGSIGKAIRPRATRPSET